MNVSLIDSFKYIETLRKNFLPYINDLEDNFILMQDNAPVHKSKKNFGVLKGE